MNGKNLNNGKIVVECEIEGFKFALFDNGDENSYQTLNVEFNGLLRPIGVIAPIDFPQIISAMLDNGNGDLNGFINDIKGCWTDELIEKVINGLFDEINGF